MTGFLAQAAPPAGGSAVGEIVAASLVAAVAVAAVIALGVAHRRRGLLDPLVRRIETATGLPAWSVLPTFVAGASLLLAVWGYYWDVSWHIDRGRDSGAFDNPAHWFIILGLDGIAFAGLLALFLGDDRSPAALRLTRRWSVPAGGVLLTACGVIALAGFPLDDIWHRLFGQDVTAWGPTHVQMIGGASLSTLACWVLQIEGRRAVAGDLPALGQRLLRGSDVALAGAFLVGLSTLQVEFDFGVPQFRLLEHPVLVTIAAAAALTAARIRVGRGGALLAVLFFLGTRILLAAGVAASGRIEVHFPLYVASAVLVELVALAVDPRRRPVTFGVATGAAVATAGFASEWAWSRARMPIGWSDGLLPEAVPVVLAAGVGAGILGGLIGRALVADPAAQPTPRGVAALGWIGAVGAVAFALPMTADVASTAELEVTPTATDPGMADVAVRIDPADAAEGAMWFEVLWWQGAADGGDGGSSRTALVRQADGSYLTAAPVPIEGSGKTIVRLHRGTSLQSLPVYLPEDEAIPAPAVAAADGERAFVADKRVLQREARTDNVGLERAAYVLLALLGAGWMAVMSWGLRRLDPTPRRPAGPAPEPAGSRAGRARPALS